MPISKVVFGDDTIIDITDTTATASDVAEGKILYTADGLRTVGTGAINDIQTNTIKPFVIRADAELVNSWSYDKLIVSDLGVTIPAYSTSSTTVVPASTLVSNLPFDFTEYTGIFICRTLATPIYDSDSFTTGRVEFSSYLMGSELVVSPAGYAKTKNGTGVAKTARVFSRPLYATLDWSGYNASPIVVTQAYGCILACSNPSVSVSNVITVYSPSFALQGDATHFKQSAWEHMTDVRVQYILELYRIPITGQNDGFMVQQLLQRVIDCFDSVSGALT